MKVYRGTQKLLAPKFSIGFAESILRKHLDSSLDFKTLCRMNVCPVHLSWLMGQLNPAASSKK